MEASTPAPGPPERGTAAYLAELIGTFALVFLVTMAVSEFGTQQNWVAIGLVHFFVLFMLVQTLAVISGAHFNPAVTVAMTALRQIRPSDAVIYVILQLTGGILGALATRALLPEIGVAVNWGAVSVSPTLGGTFAGMMVELMGTFFLMWAIVGAAVNPRSKAEWAGLVIGATLGLGVIVGAQLTGAGYNPARAFGPALVSGQFGGAGTFIIVYVVGPLVGAVLAAFVYFRVALAPGKKGTAGAEPVG
jgi:MIP family channel proteins